MLVLQYCSATVLQYSSATVLYCTVLWYCISIWYLVFGNLATPESVRINTTGQQNNEEKLLVSVGHRGVRVCCNGRRRQLHIKLQAGARRNVHSEVRARLGQHGQDQHVAAEQ